MRAVIFILSLVAIVAAGPVAAETLVIPSFAYNVGGLDGHSWSSEVYLANPSRVPIQVSLVSLLPGYVKRPTPCDQFMSPTRVVPAQSAVVWTAAGLAVDLGCAEQALGALVLKADGPIRVTSRLVSHAEGEKAAASGLLIGRGQEMRAVPSDALPGPGSYLLPALTWRCDGCPDAAFDTYVGFANPGSEAVTVSLDLPDGRGDRALDVAGTLTLGTTMLPLPATFEVPAGSWLQARVAMAAGTARPCDGPGTFDLIVTLDRRLAVYATVVDRSSHDARTVEPVALD